MNVAERTSKRSGLIGIVIAVYAVALLMYAEIWAFTFDESFHLLAAQLIGRGKRPYLDFCFPQTPLNAYWNAAWMRLLGENWRVPHFFAALFTLAAVALTVKYISERFPEADWRTAAAIAAALLTGLNAMVFIYGPLAQAYGVCLFALMVAFHASIRSVERAGVFYSAAAGGMAGIASSSSLLSAAAAPVLLIWMLFYNRQGGRAVKFFSFCAGYAIPLVPVAWLAWQGPRQAWFNLVQYHVYFRKLYWPETTRHDLEILTSWIDSGQALSLGLLALCALIYTVRHSSWPRARKAELYLCAWLAVALALEAGLAHPTFARYFLLIVPFLAILAAVGLYAVASRLFTQRAQLRAVLPLAALLLLGLSKSLYDRRDIGDWSSYERLAKRVNEVTPAGGMLFANEPIYFLTGRTPPPGFELSYSHKVDLGAAANRMMHLLTEAQVKQEVQAGRFATAYTCDDEVAQDLKLPDLYAQREDLEDCTVFWGLKGAAARARRK